MYFIRLCLLLFYLKTLIHCEIITLKYNNSVVCVATESDVNSTIYLQPQIGNATLNKTLKVEFEWTNDDWEYKILNSGIVTDERWQEFKIVENVSYNKSGTYGLSMCGKGNLTLDNTSMIQHPTNRTCDEWKHYKVEIEKTNTSSIITVFDETNRTITKTYGVDETIEIKSTQGPSFWKMHKIKCRRSSKPSNASSSIDFFWSGKMHLSMFVYLKVNSILNIELKSDDKNVSRTIHGELNSTKWQKVELTIESVNKATLYIDRLTNNDKEKPFWAIDAINFNSHEPAIYQANLTEHYESPFPICKPLNSTNYEKEECTQEEKNSNCEFVHKANFSRCQTVKNTNGFYYDCDTCHEFRAYFYCVIFPVLIPTLEKISNESVTIRVNNFRYGSYEREPKYHVQFKQENEQQFKTFQTIPYSKRNETLEISELSTRDWSYKIRILPTVDNKSCEVKVPELEVFKRSLKTTRITPTSISLSWSDNMKSKSSEWIIHFRCQQLNCTKPELVNSINVKKLTQNISRLEPLTTCDFKLYTKNKLLIDMISETTPAKSLDDGEFPIVSFPNDFHIKIKFPEFNGPLTYNVSYLCVSQWCKEDSVGSFSTTRKNCKRKEFIRNVTLQPFSDYNVTVTVSRSTDKRSKTYQLKTRSGKPKEVQNLSIYCRNRESFWIRWNPPDPPTEEILNYRILQENKNLTHWKYTSCTWKNFTCVILDAKSVSSKIFVQALNNSAELGEPKSLFLSLNDFQRPQNLILKINSSNEVTVTWEHPFVKNFSLIISSKGATDNYTVMSDNCTHKYGKSITIENDIMYKISVWPESSQTENATITALFKASPPELSSKPLLKLCFDESDINCTFLIPKPEQSTETSCRIEVDQNGAKWYITNLHVDDNDYLSVANDSLSVNCFQDVIKQTFPVYLINGNRSYLICQATNQAATTAALICFVIVAVVTFLFVGYLIFAYTFRKYPFEIRRTRGANKDEIHPTETDTSRSYQEKNVRTLQKECVLPQDNMELQVLIESEKPHESVKLINSEPIQVKDFENYLMASLEDNSLTDQYKNLQTNKNKKSSTAGSLQKNNHKNRYKNILAYDHSRVILQKMDGMGTDNYINANYINGVDHPKAYIATQGPKFSTIRDFWRMIWQEQVQTIVMATNFVESKERKCAEYWPQRLNCIFEFGEMGITLISEENFEHYDRRTLEMKYRGEVRAVQHYHLKWNPDQLTPLYPDRVVPLVKQIRNVRENSTTPIVIHCSSGVNRTGTLILCDMALQMAAQQNSIDFYKLTKDLRDQRPNMVSTEKQYLLAHLVVLECLMEEENVFRKIIEENLALKPYKAQLNYLDRLSWHDDEVQSWVPYQAVALSPGLPVAGYAKNKKYVVVRQPHESSLSDFWHLVVKEKIQIILFLNQSKCDMWTYSKRKYDSGVSVKAVDQICTNYCTTTELSLKYTQPTINISYKQKVYFFQLAGWKSTKKVPQDVESVLNVLDDIQKNYCFEKPILLACHDGIVASGLFAALSYIIEKFQKEVDFDICNGVRTVRRSCKQFVSTTKQMEFLYLAVLQYLQKFDSYSCVL
ncbi:uncharacterized protein [Tenebrio molitor]|uniref:uncharacterized protein isoform X2 n=1 Tax=Tenebrio molitor TaxID=7067 RepID=UPI003624A315